MADENAMATGEDSMADEYAMLKGEDDDGLVILAKEDKRECWVF